MALVKPKSLKTRNSEISKSISSYVEGSDDLSVLTLEQLAARYEEIDQQSQLFKGLILLEARSRFPSNNEFGDWVQSVPSLCGDGNQVRNRYMNFANYFKDRDRTGITITACYEISAPINADIADKVYQVALNKNLSVAQIKAEIAKAKGLLPESVNEGSGEPELMPLEDISRFMEQVLADIGELPVNEAIRVLKECEKQLKKNSKTVSPVED
jgi:hypothetical protein